MGEKGGEQQADGGGRSCWGSLRGGGQISTGNEGVTVARRKRAAGVTGGLRLPPTRIDRPTATIDERLLAQSVFPSPAHRQELSAD